jgi:hypothetical protein
MNYMKTIFALTTLVVLSSCNQKATNDAMAETKKTEMHTKMTANGFKMGTIVASKVEGDCPYVIEMEGDNKPYYLDPINLDESFKKNGEKIWFTFGPLRMMNRCEKANPVSIIEMEKREE